MKQRRFPLVPESNSDFQQEPEQQEMSQARRSPLYLRRSPHGKLLAFVGRFALRILPSSRCAPTTHTSSRQLRPSSQAKVEPVEDTQEIYDPYAMPPEAIREPPTSLWVALLKIGPGIILAGSIVGSGELIITTKLGAEHGFVFLWLILFSCLIKVFVQIELGRIAITSGKPTLGLLNEFAGPRFGAHWSVWWWFFMLLATVFQLGGMTAGVGQALNLAFPDVVPSIAHWCGDHGISPAFQQWLVAKPERLWAIGTCMICIGLLQSGSYHLVESLAVFLVATVTLLTVACVLGLYRTEYAIGWNDVSEGFTFAIPAAGIMTAFSMFGITGVGATELYAYPYWCLEKGYARFAGKREATNDWERRARGWIRVMHLDAWASMVVFTVATVAFYCMGAAVLHPQGLIPSDSTMIATLSKMYAKPFGNWTILVFLIGAGITLFKTLYVSCASHSRLTADFFALAGFVRFSDGEDRSRLVQRLCIFYPLLALMLYLVIGSPQQLVVFGAIAQGLTLPIISCSALILRYRYGDKATAPSIVNDALLWIAVLLISAVAMVVVNQQLKGIFR